MLAKLLIAWLLMAACVVVHAIGTTAALHWVEPRAGRRARFWSSTWMLVRMAGWIILLHLLQIALWAVVYDGVGAMPDLRTAFYFSAVTYTTTGYGDVLLTDEWRLGSGIEALTGILMCGWSAAFFFAVATRMQRERQTPEPS